MPKQNHLTKNDKLVLDSITNSKNNIGKSIEEFKLREGLNEVMNLARTGNKYLAENEPWKTKKTDEPRTETVLNIALQISATLAFVCEPYLPFTSKKLKNLLNLVHYNWDEINSDIMKKGDKINQHEHLFQKIEDEKIVEQLQKLNN